MAILSTMLKFLVFLLKFMSLNVLSILVLSLLLPVGGLLSYTIRWWHQWWLSTNMVLGQLRKAAH